VDPRVGALSAPAPEPQPAALIPRDAATLIVVDARGGAPRVLMGKRHGGHRFMPNKFVFPGGALEAADRRVTPLTPLHPAVAHKLAVKPLRRSAALAQTLALAAIRETFEETGLAIGDPGAAPRAHGGPWDAFAALGVAPALDGVDFLARAITPPGRWRRFDARFFVVGAERIRAEAPGIVHTGAELTELVWTSLAATQTLDLPEITRMVLKDLRAVLDGAAALDRPRPFYRTYRGTFRRELL